MSSHANRGERNLTEERQIAAEAAWNAAKKSAGRQAGCFLFVLFLAILPLVYGAGYVAAWRPACSNKPSHVSTP